MVFKAKNFSQLSAGEIYEILKARAAVFVVEQKISYVDMDDIDYSSRHFFLEENGEVTAYARAFYENDEKETVHIGRVLTVNHGNGQGKLIMEKTIEDIKKNMKCNKIRLNSQTQAVGFYKKLGFNTVSEEFFIQNIPHYTMEFTL